MKDLMRRWFSLPIIGLKSDDGRIISAPS